MTIQVHSVPRFGLFGESARGEHEELVHCETIAVRSRLHNWEIDAHRHPSLCQLLLVTEGDVAVLLDGHRLARSAPILLVVPPGIVHGFRFAPETRGLVLSLSGRFLGLFGDDRDVRSLLLCADAIELEPQDARRLDALGEQLLLAHREGAAHDRLRRALAEAFVRIAAEYRPGRERQRGDALVHRFQLLVQDSMRHEHRMTAYADRLHCTGRTLSRRVSAALGISPAQYLHDRLAAEASRLLRFTNASCAEIADELGFVDPSYFSRFYKRITGASPTEFRTGQPS
ncbi:MAG: helix-turn-helix domain-containing protein [Sphingobium sp.]